MIRLTETKFEDLELPNRLYKFRNWSIPEHKRILTHREIYFAPHNSFGDHHEHNLPQDYDSITEDILFNYFYKSAESRIGPVSHDTKLAFANYWVKHTQYRSPRHRQEVEERFQSTLNKRKGIFSMSPERDNKNLWATFAHEHRGFA